MALVSRLFYCMSAVEEWRGREPAEALQFELVPEFEGSAVQSRRVALIRLSGFLHNTVGCYFVKATREVEVKVISLLFVGVGRVKSVEGEIASPSSFR